MSDSKESTPGPWKVHQCGEALGSERACEIHGPPDPSVPYQMRQGFGYVVTDTNREECCHMMKLVDAELIVKLRNTVV